MMQTFEAENHLREGKPAGGWARAIGVSIFWQDGPLGRGEERKEPNGAFVETVIAIAQQRLEHYQATEFACEENALAADYLAAALRHLNKRTERREERGVEGTHTA